MARNSSGTHSLPSAAPNPVVSGTTITSTWANTTLGDISTEITDSLSRTGKGGMTAPLRCADGTVAAPAHSYTSETGSGWFRHAAGELRLAILGVYRLAVTATLTTINSAASVLGALTVTGDATAANLTSYDRVNVFDGSAGKKVSLDAPAGLAADYDIRFPASLPGSTLPLTLSSAGAMATAQLVNAQQNFGTPSASTDVVIKSYLVPETSATSSPHANSARSPSVYRTAYSNRAWFVEDSGGTFSATGAITGCAIGGDPTGAGVLFVVPSGYRPLRAVVAPVMWYDQSTTTLRSAMLQVLTNGNVTFWGQIADAAQNLANGDLLYVGSVAPWTTA